MVIDRIIKPNTSTLFTWTGYPTLIVLWPILFIMVYMTLNKPKPICAHCGLKLDSMDEATDHMTICKVHPMRKLEAENDRLKLRIKQLDQQLLGMSREKQQRLEELETERDATQSWRNLVKAHEKENIRLRADLQDFMTGDD